MVIAEVDYIGAQPLPFILVSPSLAGALPTCRQGFVAFRIQFVSRFSNVPSAFVCPPDRFGRTIKYGYSPLRETLPRSEIRAYINVSGHAGYQKEQRRGKNPERPLTSRLRVNARYARDTNT